MDVLQIPFRHYIYTNKKILGVNNKSILKVYI